MSESRSNVEAGDELRPVVAALRELLEEEAWLRTEGLPVELPPSADGAQRVVQNLNEVRTELGECTRCKLCQTRNKIVFGAGNPRAEIVFVGEGPGRDEDLTGEPFVGAAGKLLTKIIEAMGFRRDDVYIANVVKCRPPQNRDPEKDEIAACIPFLHAQLAAIAPRVVVTLGKWAAWVLLETESSISRLRGTVRDYRGVPLVPTFHPAYLLRNPDAKRLVWDDMKTVLGILGRDVPAK